jgi:DNA-binding NtrC family response regulator
VQDSADPELRESADRRIIADMKPALPHLDPRPGLDPEAHASPLMRALVVKARRIADIDTSLLLRGETGSGKEWLARAIHREGARASGPFVAINCAAVPDSLLESELFGHERGAFTSATHAHRGFFEMARGGVLFLDEIGDTSTQLQAKLLRVLQDHEVRPVGAEAARPVDVRVIAATNRDLEAAAEDGSFRVDLLYRLAVVTLDVPPLRERPEDLEVLLDAYRAHFAERFGRPVRSVSPEAVALLRRYRWPGNIRELINTVERAVALAEGDELTCADLPEALCRKAPVPQSEAEPTGAPASDLFEMAYADALAEFERRYLDHHLARAGGRVAEAAKALGLPVRTLYDRRRRRRRRTQW